MCLSEINFNNDECTSQPTQHSGRSVAEWRQFTEIINAIRASEQRLLRTATRDEIAAELGLSPKAYLSLIMQLGKVSRPFLTAAPNALVRLMELAPGQTIASVGSDASEPEVVNLMAKSISAMPSDERIVFALYFKEKLSLAEISEVVKLDSETVFYLGSHAIFRLRSCLTYDWPTLKAAN